jgi:hypothetical protein
MKTMPFSTKNYQMSYKTKIPLLTNEEIESLPNNDIRVKYNRKILSKRRSVERRYQRSLPCDDIAEVVDVVEQPMFSEVVEQPMFSEIPPKHQTIVLFRGLEIIASHEHNEACNCEVFDDTGRPMCYIDLPDLIYL